MKERNSDDGHSCKMNNSDDGGRSSFYLNRLSAYRI